MVSKRGWSPFGDLVENAGHFGPDVLLHLSEVVGRNPLCPGLMGTTLRKTFTVPLATALLNKPEK